MSVLSILIADDEALTRLDIKEMLGLGILFAVKQTMALKP